MAIDSTVDIYLERKYLGPMMIEDVASPKELKHAVGKFAKLADDSYIFYYKGVNGYIRMADYLSFNEFKNNLRGIDIVAIGMGETVNFP